jgi:hypothetical protein
MVLIESPSFAMTPPGRIAANGGGGGSYNSSGTAAGVAGGNGNLDDTAPYGANGTGYYASGGAGGAGSYPGGVLGQSATGAGQQVGGAGGGAAGIIIIRNVAGSYAFPGGAILSPHLNTMNDASQVVCSVQAAVVQ